MIVDVASLFVILRDGGFGIFFFLIFPALAADQRSQVFLFAHYSIIT